MTDEQWIAQNPQERIEMTTTNMTDTITALAESLQNKCVVLISERDTIRAEVEAVRKANLDCVDHYNDARAEIDTLHAQLAAIAATEPVARAVADKTNTGFVYVRVLADELLFGTELFARPMPAQDVTELVDALEKLARLGNGEQYGNSDGNMIARDALSKYKGAK